MTRNVMVNFSFIDITSQPRPHKKLQRRCSTKLKNTVLMRYGTRCTVSWIFAENEMTFLIFFR
jgi:hypothetical protein